MSKYKLIIDNPEQSRQVQEHAFKLGCRWPVSGQNVVHTESKYLYIRLSSPLVTIERGIETYLFVKSNLNLITVEDFLQIEPNKEQGSFSPGQPVLVKNDISNDWEYTLYSHYDELREHVTVSGYYHTCIPFKGNGHLVGTSNNI